MAIGLSGSSAGFEFKSLGSILVKCVRLLGQVLRVLSQQWIGVAMHRDSWHDSCLRVRPER